MLKRQFGKRNMLSIWQIFSFLRNLNYYFQKQITVSTIAITRDGFQCGVDPCGQPFVSTGGKPLPYDILSLTM